MVARERTDSGFDNAVATRRARRSRRGKILSTGEASGGADRHLARKNAVDPFAAAHQAVSLNINSHHLAHQMVAGSLMALTELDIAYFSYFVCGQKV